MPFRYPAIATNLSDDLFEGFFDPRTPCKSQNY